MGVRVVQRGAWAGAGCASASRCPALCARASRALCAHTGQHRLQPAEEAGRKVGPAGPLHPPVLAPAATEESNESARLAGATAAARRAGRGPARRPAPARSARCASSPGPLRMLAKWRQSTRLETRTKESNNDASVWVASPYAQ